MGPSVENKIKGSFIHLFIHSILVQVYEISMSAIIRLECDGDDCEKKGKELVEEEGKLNMS